MVPLRASTKQCSSSDILMLATETLSWRTSEYQNCEVTNLCCLRHELCCNLLKTQWESRTVFLRTSVQTSKLNLLKKAVIFPTPLYRSFLPSGRLTLFMETFFTTRHTFYLLVLNNSTYFISNSSFCFSVIKSLQIIQYYFPWQILMLLPQRTLIYKPIPFGCPSFHIQQHVFILSLLGHAIAHNSQMSFSIEMALLFKLMCTHKIYE